MSSGPPSSVGPSVSQVGLQATSQTKPPKPATKQTCAASIAEYDEDDQLQLLNQLPTLEADLASFFSGNSDTFVLNNEAFMQIEPPFKPPSQLLADSTILTQPLCVLGLNLSGYDSLINGFGTRFIGSEPISLHAFDSTNRHAAIPPFACGHTPSAIWDARLSRPSAVTHTCLPNALPSSASL